MLDKMPLTVKRSIELLGLCALGLVISLGQNVIMPILLAFFISLLLLPLFRFLNNKLRIPETIAIAISIIAFLLFLAGIIAFLSFQVGILVSDIDEIQRNLSQHWEGISSWISKKLHYSDDQQMAMLNNQVKKLGPNAVGYLQGAALSLTGILMFVGLVPIYIFLILFYRNLLLRFTYLWFQPEQHPKVESAVRETEVIVKYYLVGLLIQIAYLTILLGGSLLLFGIKHAILIGVVFAILNLIPYIGALIGNLVGVILTLTSSQDYRQIIIVLVTIAVVQFLDNNILMPRIVGSKVKVNAFASIVGIVIGGTIAGISGMFISIPVMAVLKIMFDKSANMRQWGVLIGDHRPEGNPSENKLFRGFKRKGRVEKKEESKSQTNDKKE